MGEETNSIVPSSFVDFDNLKDNEGVVYPYEGQKGVVIQQQWVTLTASMWPEPTEAPRGWKIASERLPLLAAIFCGAAVVVCLLCAFVLYRCCVMPRREKHLYIRKVDGSTNTRTSPPQSQAAIYAQPTGCSWSYNNRIINPIPGSPWYTPRIIGGPQCTQCPGICPVPRSKSSLGNPEVHQGQVRTNTTRKQRPLSQPIHITTNLYSNGEILPRSFPMPEISEFSPHGQQYASSSILDDAKDDGSEEIPTLKTRSLPAWVRNKPRPLSTEDDLNELYAKVNFSKKRKNRMRNDEAAIIALSKSRSQFLHKDTDNLVDNEAVIVYDERTAL